MLGHEGGAGEAAGVVVGDAVDVPFVGVGVGGEVGVHLFFELDLVAAEAGEPAFGGDALGEGGGAVVVEREIAGDVAEIALGLDVGQWGIEDGEAEVCGLDAEDAEGASCGHDDEAAGAVTDEVHGLVCVESAGFDFHGELAADDLADFFAHGADGGEVVDEIVLEGGILRGFVPIDEADFGQALFEIVTFFEGVLHALHPAAFVFFAIRAVMQAVGDEDEAVGGALRLRIPTVCGGAGEEAAIPPVDGAGGDVVFGHVPGDPCGGEDDGDGDDDETAKDDGDDEADAGGEAAEKAMVPYMACLLDGGLDGGGFVDVFAVVEELGVLGLVEPFDDFAEEDVFHLMDDAHGFGECGGFLQSGADDIEEIDLEGVASGAAIELEEGAEGLHQNGDEGERGAGEAHDVVGAGDAQEVVGLAADDEGGAGDGEEEGAIE